MKGMEQLELHDGQLAEVSILATKGSQLGNGPGGFCSHLGDGPGGFCSHLGDGPEGFGGLDISSLRC